MTIRYVLCLLLVLYVTHINSKHSKCKKECPEHQTLKDSGFDCNNCVYHQAGIMVKCAITNKTQCYCDDGYFRLAPGENGRKCITEKECDNYCEKNEILKKCDQPTACEPSCQEPDRQPCPTKRCIPGCDCKPEYLRDDKTGKCIPKNECTKQ